MRKIEVIKKIGNILERRESVLSALFYGINDLSVIESNTLQFVIDELLDEFLSEGLKQDDEPNEYGLLVDDLLAACTLELSARAPNNNIE